MIEMIDITDLNPAAVLAGLFNGATPSTLVSKQPVNNLQDMNAASARILIQQNESKGLSGLEFFEIDGRILMVNLEGNSFAPGLYDRANSGTGSAQAIVDEIRKTT